MDNSFHRQESDTQQKRGFSTEMWIFDSLLPLMRHSLKRLADFFQLTDEEQENAGVFLGRLGDD